MVVREQQNPEEGELEAKLEKELRIASAVRSKKKRHQKVSNSKLTPYKSEKKKEQAGRKKKKKKKPVRDVIGGLRDLEYNLNIKTKNIKVASAEDAESPMKTRRVISKTMAPVKVKLNTLLRDLEPIPFTEDEHVGSLDTPTHDPWRNVRKSQVQGCWPEGGPESGRVLQSWYCHVVRRIIARQ